MRDVDPLRGLVAGLWILGGCAALLWGIAGEKSLFLAGVIVWAALEGGVYGLMWIRVRTRQIRLVPA